MKTLLAITPDNTKDILSLKELLKDKEIFENKGEHILFCFKEVLNETQVKALEDYNVTDVIEAFIRKEKGLKYRGMYVEERARKKFLQWYVENFFYHDFDYARKVLTEKNIYEYFKSLNESCLSWYIERKLPKEHPFFFLYALLNTKEFESFIKIKKLGYPLNYRLFRKRTIEYKSYS